MLGLPHDRHAPLSDLALQTVLALDQLAGLDHRRDSVTEVVIDDDQQTDRFEAFDLQKLGACRGSIRLIVVSGESLGQRFLVGEGASLGRSSSCTVLIRDPRVSRLQAKLETDEDGRLVLVDSSGKGTTRINGDVVERHRLRFGDRIQVGHTMLVVAPQTEDEREELEQDRLQAIGYLSSGIAHDFNNMLGVVIASLSFLESSDASTAIGDTMIQQCMEDIREAAERSSDLVKRMLVFARQQDDVSEMCNMALICQDVLRLAQRGFPSRIRIESAIEPGLWVFGSRSQLVQMVLNLCINARDAMPEGGVLRISAERDRQFPSIRLTIEDTGIGMDDETKDRIFDRFFTTKEQKGTGLGLTLVSEVVRWHGGRIAVESDKGRGTRFTVHLPYRSPDLAESKGLTTMATPTPAGTSFGKILIVDDDPMVLRATSRLLQQAGHTTLLASDGLEAVHVYTQSTPRPDLVLLDLDMRGLDGEETWLQLRRADPAVRVIFVSGYTRKAAADRLVREGALAFVHKPFDAARLRVLLRDVLQG